MRRTAFAVVVLVAFACCRGAEPGGQTGALRASLRLVDGCEDLEAVLRESAIEQMREQVLANYEESIDPDYCSWGDADYAADGVDADADADGDGDSDVSESGGEEGASEYSTTNTQEAGVDEADFVKNDGSYIYIASGNELLVIDAWPATETSILSRTTLDGTARLLYVLGDLAVVYSDVVDETGERRDDCYYDEYSGSSVCGASTSGTRISLFDLTDRASPRLTREIVISGLYVNSRRIGNAVHTVMTYPEVMFPDLSYWPEDFDPCAGTGRFVAWRAFQTLIVENTRIINSTPIESFVPSMSDTRYAEDGTPDVRENLLGDCRGFYEATESSGRTFLTVASFDLSEVADVAVTSIVGDPGVVYASSEALYVASRQYFLEEGGWFFEGGDDEATTIHKFLFVPEAAAVAYDASGVVPGRILNQFSMGEHDGFLRIATTSGYLPDPDATNQVYVLGSSAGALEILGSVTGIAPTEDIRSARFIGDRGYVVTFKKTDPLFVLDLSDPSHPFVAGELEIPGFSTYMHPMDGDHLLTIGFDADDQGDFAWFMGIQLQIFDVSDMSNPVRTHHELIGTRGTNSDATADHLAFNYFAPRDLLAIPMAICGGGGPDGVYGDALTFSGLLVYDVTVEDGFSEHGRISHADPSDLGTTDGCWNWWSEPSSHVKRSIIMDDFVFSIATDEIIVADLADLSSPVATVELPGAAAPVEPSE